MKTFYSLLGYNILSFFLFLRFLLFPFWLQYHDDMVKNIHTSNVFYFQVEYSYFLAIVNRRKLDAHKGRIAIITKIVKINNNSNEIKIVIIILIILR